MQSRWRYHGRRVYAKRLFMPGTPGIHFEEPFLYEEDVLTLRGRGGNIYIISDLHLAAEVKVNDNYEGPENFMAGHSFARMIRYLLDQPHIKKHTLVSTACLDNLPLIERRSRMKL